MVIDAFSTGGAGQNGDRKLRELEMEDSIEFSPAKKHNMRVGVQLESFCVNSLERQNFNGTFTFASNAAFDAGLPSTYRQRIGTGLVDYAQWQAAWYVQDDWTIRKTFSLSLGLRHEFQSHLDDADRVRAADWGDLDAWQVHRARRVGHLQRVVRDEPLRADAARQRRHPAGRGRAEPRLSGSVRGRTCGGAAGQHHPAAPRTSPCRGCTRPRSAIERTFGALRLQTNYFMQRGHDQFRSVNVNAPVNGVRPIPEAGNITQLESTG